ncbi:MAG TPA: hypothetical protein PLL23_00380 [Chitinophagaceae bacterium]|nr:hypothetical protein [Chitinophagaceae bacterium]
MKNLCFFFLYLIIFPASAQVITPGQDTAAAFYYQQAGEYAVRNEHAAAFRFLKEAIVKGARGEDVLTDTDFTGLQKDLNGWAEIEVLLKSQYVASNPGISKPDLGYELWRMWVEDQRYRTLKRNYKLPGNPVTDIALHQQQLIRVKEIIKNSGWPTYSKVGRAGGDAVFFVFQHDDAKNMKKVLPLLIAAAKAGEADMSKAAMMIDRYLAYTEQVQLYGSQAFRRIKPGQDRKDIPLTLYPIAGEERMLERRKALGMVDFFENCRQLGVEYISIENRTDYKPIGIKKKWVDAGYLLTE